MFYPLENFIRKLRRYFSRSERTVRRLHLTTSEKTESEHGLLLIQIDGLSKTQMERAMRRGRLPFLKSLLQKQKYETHTFYSGIPSTTPAVQAELHYRVRCAVPAFSFLDRSAQKIATMCFVVAVFLVAKIEVGTALRLKLATRMVQLSDSSRLGRKPHFFEDVLPV